MFIGNQREQVLKAIRLLDPSFEPHIKIENIYYSCSLLNHLNTQQVIILQTFNFYLHVTFFINKK